MASTSTSTKAPTSVPDIFSPVTEFSYDSSDERSESVDDDEDPPASSERRFRDNVHGYIPISQRVCDFIDTEHFQRLKKIKQLGTSYYVWPGASHNRFEHCLGTAHLAYQTVTHLQSSQPSLHISDRDVECVQIAGLCHDLGHGPWSHVWDGMFIPRALKDSTWQHEDASEMMFDDLVASKPIEISAQDVAFIKALIAGDPRKAFVEDQAESKSFLFDIVANKTNGIDVDKFDYIARDYAAIGEQTNTSFLRLIKSARVIHHVEIDGVDIGSRICYDIKDANYVYSLCQTRFWLHKTFYSHKTARAVEYMIVDALLLAEPHLKIAERIRDPKKFLYLTDSIMDRIQESTELELEASRALFRRIARRELYRLVDYVLISWESRESIKLTVTPEAIVAAAKRLFATSTGPDDVPTTMVTGNSKDSKEAKDAKDAKDVDPELLATLSPEHVIVDVSSMHYGMKDKNPLDYVKFYGKRNLNTAILINKAHFSTSLPAKFAEATLRIYARDQQYLGLIQAGFREVMKGVEGFEAAPDGQQEGEGEVSRAPATHPREPGVNLAESSSSGAVLGAKPGLGAASGVEVREATPLTSSTDDGEGTTAAPTPRTASLASLGATGAAAGAPGTPPPKMGTLAPFPSGSSGPSITPGTASKIVLNPLTTLPPNYPPSLSVSASANSSPGRTLHSRRTSGVGEKRTRTRSPEKDGARETRRKAS